ncbi:unnamed protein product [Urochloa decumbens]|uniref:F-box protein At3g26010-like beta-propeller domain-containing protein n=1 Tax=Urochloa decumbens TaxID=240449 RepID=A0ABC9G9N0_9POAL
MVEILARVPARSVYRSKCVAKAWRDLIDDPLNRKKLPQTLEGFFFKDKPSYVRDGGDAEHFVFINFLSRSVPLDIDPCFSFLTKRAEIENLFFEDSCNGLLLFGHVPESNAFDLSYIVCNPATKQWDRVSTCSCCPPVADCSQEYTFLAFDPAVSSHFHLLNFWIEGLDEGVEPLEDQVFLFSVCAYSSETRTWNRSQTNLNEQGQLEGWRQGSLDYKGPQHAYVNGTLHLIVRDQGQDQIVALDVQGKTKRIITLPAVAEGRRWKFIGYICQSQGRLHYINNDVNAHGRKKSYELSIWVLQDYDTQEWVLKHTVSFLKLFGKLSCTSGRSDFFVVAIHQDCNVIFILQPSNRLIAYDMDHKQVSVIATFEHKNWDATIASYIPYFSESLTLTNKL